MDNDSDKDAEENRATGMWPEDVENKLASLSHEFKSPLAVTLSALQLLEYKTRLLGPENYEEEFGKFFEIAKRNVYKTLRMANNFVDTGRLSAGYATITREAVDLCTLLHYTIRATRSFAALRGTDLVLSCEVDAPFVAMCDKQMIDRVVLNLLSNALKHLPEECGKIEVILQMQDDNALMIVRDNGCGIRPEHLPRVFEKYWHLDSVSTGSDRHGTGLGLYIVQSLVQLHGGSIAVKSVLGEGSEFCVSIPRHSDEMTDTLRAASEDYHSDAQTLQASIEFSGVY